MKTAFTVAACLVTSVVFAADPPQQQKPSEQHALLKQFVGEWDSKAKGPAEPGSSEMIECTASLKNRMLGEFWMISEIESDLGAPVKMHAIQTLGYDPKTKKYVGTWVDTMLNHLWKYEGTVDATGKIFTLEAEGPNVAGDTKTTAKFRDIYEFKTKDQIQATSQMQDKNGKWVTFMTGMSVRRK